MSSILALRGVLTVRDEMPDIFAEGPLANGCLGKH